MCLHSNILELTNEFHFPDQNITLDNYENWLTYLNNSDPARVESLDLRHCDLKRFLDQVLVAPHHFHLLTFLKFY